MTAPNGEEIGVLAVLTEVEVVEKITLHQGSVFEGGKLKISGVGFGRGEKTDLGLLSHCAIGDDKKSNGKQPEKMGNNERGDGKNGGLDVLGFIFLLF